MIQWQFQKLNSRNQGDIHILNKSVKRQIDGQAVEIENKQSEKKKKVTMKKKNTKSNCELTKYVNQQRIIDLQSRVQ